MLCLINSRFARLLQGSPTKITVMDEALHTLLTTLSWSFVMLRFFNTFATRTRVANSFFVALVFIALSGVSSAAFASATLTAHWAWPGQNAVVSGKLHFTVNGSQLKTVKLYVGSTLVLNCAISPDGRRVATGSSRPYARRW